MNKLKAIKLYKQTRLEDMAGAGDLGTAVEHVYYEVCNFLEENEWMEEAKAEFKSALEEKRRKLEPIKEQFYNYLKEGKRTNKEDEYYRNNFNSFCVDGEEEEKVIYKVKYGVEPTQEILRDILVERHRIDEANENKFLKAQVNIYLGKEYNQEELKESAEALRKHGLLKKAYKKVPSAVNSYVLENILD